MRCNATIVGIGKRRTGTSKAGKNYDFVPVAITYQDPQDADFEGVKAETINVDFPTFNASDLAVGDTVDAVMHFQNYKLYLDAVLN